jgi:hypothetical protein
MPRDVKTNAQHSHASATETGHSVTGGGEVSRDTMREEGPGLATAALVGVGVAIFQPELIPGILIGAGAVLAPRFLPAMGNVFRPLLKGAVRAGYGVATTVREAVAEASEQVEDIVAEARAEQQHAEPARETQHAKGAKPHPQAA